MSEGTSQSLHGFVPQGGILIEFLDVSTAEAGRRASEMQIILNNSLRDVGESATAERIRVNPEAQELGTLIGVLLGAKATIEIAKGIAKWLVRSNQAKIRITSRSGKEVVISNIESKDLADVLRSLVS
jgi:hypothetical protein